MPEKENLQDENVIFLFQKRNIFSIVKIPRKRQKSSGSSLQPSVHSKS